MNKTIIGLVILSLVILALFICLVIGTSCSIKSRPNDTGKHDIDKKGT